MLLSSPPSPPFVPVSFIQLFQGSFQLYQLSFPFTEHCSSSFPPFLALPMFLPLVLSPSSGPLSFLCSSPLTLVLSPSSCPLPFLWSWVMWMHLLSPRLDPANACIQPQHWSVNIARKASLCYLLSATCNLWSYPAALVGERVWGEWRAREETDFNRQRSDPETVFL